MAAKNIAIIVGSLRKESYNRKMAHVLIGFASNSLAMEIVEIGDLMLYNEDLDAKPPSTWLNFRERIKRNDGVLFVTPEYNRSVPGVLKNALDVGSRPYGKSVWERKPAAVVSLSPGAIGGFGANHHLRQTLVSLNMITMAQPEAYIGGAATLFDHQGNLANEGTRILMQKFMHFFTLWMERIHWDVA
ncbi:MAG: NAD(P)H-dependent oxidoreductase [Oligoflexia bacterium]|nr:NAD(P)H-dependent oxidoreductase [Oligoflexia bacterium]MBF0364327.1 NAD(P)H-dependent oxidoreductase [Oligoflexia bacterium]